MSQHDLFERQNSPVGTTVDHASLDLSRMIYMFFNHLDTQVAIADNKASIVVAVNAILLTALGLSQPTIRTLMEEDPLQFQSGIALLLLLIMLLTSLASILNAIEAARPKLVPPHTDVNLFFFGDVAAQDADTFTQAFLRQDVNGIKTHILHQIHARSRVVAKKFLRVRRSMNLLFLAAMLWSVAQVLLAV